MQAKDGMPNFNVFPLIKGEPEIPLTPDPVTLREAFQIIEQRIELLEAQGYWKGCNCQEIPIDKVGFAIRPVEG